MQNTTWAIAVVMGVLLLNVVIISAASPGTKAVIDECNTTPTVGKCGHNKKPITAWTYSKRSKTCNKIQGCYTFGDRNVFRRKVDCKDTCMKKN